MIELWVELEWFNVLKMSWRCLVWLEVRLQPTWSFFKLEDGWASKSLSQTLCVRIFVNYHPVVFVPHDICPDIRETTRMMITKNPRGKPPKTHECLLNRMASLPKILTNPHTPWTALDSKDKIVPPETWVSAKLYETPGGFFWMPYKGGYINWSMNIARVGLFPCLFG